MASQELVCYVDLEIHDVDTLVATTQGTIDIIEDHGRKVLGTLIGAQSVLESNTITNPKDLQKWITAVVKIQTMQMLGEQCAGKDVLIGQFVNASALVEAMSKVKTSIWYDALLEKEIRLLPDNASLAEVQAKTAEYIRKLKEIKESYDQFYIGVKHKAILNHKHHLRQLSAARPQLRIGAAAEIADIPRSAKPCHFFNKGTCRNGDECRFAHVPRTGRLAAPAAPAPASSAAATYASGYNKLCRNGSNCELYKQGGCNYNHPA